MLREVLLRNETLPVRSLIKHSQDKNTASLSVLYHKYSPGRGQPCAKFLLLSAYELPPETVLVIHTVKLPPHCPVTYSEKDQRELNTKHPSHSKMHWVTCININIDVSIWLWNALETSPIPAHNIEVQEVNVLIELTGDNGQSPWNRDWGVRECYIWWKRLRCLLRWFILFLCVTWCEPVLHSCLMPPQYLAAFIHQCLYAAHSLATRGCLHQGATTRRTDLRGYAPTIPIIHSNRQQVHGDITFFMFPSDSFNILTWFYVTATSLLGQDPVNSLTKKTVGAPSLEGPQWFTTTSRVIRDQH